MKLNYEIFIDEELLIQKYSGRITVSLFIKYLHILSAIPDLHLIKKIITDARDCTAEFDFKDPEIIANLRKEKVNLNKAVFHVIISDNPSTTAFAILYKSEWDKYEVKHEVCSTLNRAIKLLNLKENKAELENKINNLKQTIIITD